MSHEWIAAIAAVISAIIAIVSAAVSIIAMRGQHRLAVQQQGLEKDIASKQSDLELKLANEKQAFEQKLAQAELLYSQRSQLLPLWQYMSGLNQIDPKTPITEHILKAVNTLELVALCCEANIIDPELVRRTFRQTYIELYDQIDQVIDIPKLKKSGKKLLTENAAAMKLYYDFKQEMMTQGQVKAI